MSKTLIKLVVLLFVLVISGFILYKYISNPLPYKLANKDMGKISTLKEELFGVTRIKFSPSGDVMLVGTLTGEIYLFDRANDGSLIMRPEPIHKIQTGFPGFPPEENGLTGMAFASDFNETGEIFFAYTFKEEDNLYLNRVAKGKLIESHGNYTITNFTDIFTANTPSEFSHQIQGIVGFDINGVSHAMFLVGEGFQAERSLDLTKESGKLMLIRSDGSDPLGPRPFPNYPKIQARGLRNPPDLAINVLDPLRRQAIVDTGPDINDRFIYANFIDLVNSSYLPEVNLIWDGTDESLNSESSEVRYTWSPTHTPTNIVFHPGKGLIPLSTETNTTVLVSLFGRTGLVGSQVPGREIWLGSLPLLTDDKPSWEPFIVRTTSGIGSEGHPIGLIMDPTNMNLVFADIMTGTIYLVEIN